jgi:hypothetical protein
MNETTMLPIPDDVWACAQTIWFIRDSYARYGTAAYLIRSATHEEAMAKAKRIAEHDCRKAGGYEYCVFVNKQSGERCVGTVNDDPLFPPDPTPDVTAEAAVQPTTLYLPHGGDPETARRIIESTGEDRP